MSSRFNISSISWMLVLAAAVPCGAQQQPRMVPQQGVPQQQGMSQQYRPQQQIQQVSHRLPPVPEGMPQAPPGYELRPIEGVFNLAQLSSIAEQQHPRLARSLAEIDSAKGERVQSALYPNPRFETNNPELWAGKLSQVNFGWQQDMVVKGKLRLQKAAADQLVRKMDAKYYLTRMEMLTAIREQYFTVLAAKQRIDVADQFVRLSQQAYQTAQQLVNAGQGSSTDVLLINTELERANLDSLNARTILAGELSQLSCMVGVPDLVIRDVQGSIYDAPPAFNEQQIRQFLVTQSIHMEIAHADISRKQMQLRREEVEMYPDMRFGPHAMVQTDGTRGAFWLTVAFTIPVWDMNQGEIRRARADMMGATATMDKTRVELLQQLSETSARHVNSRNLSERIRTVILPNAQKAQKLVGEGFEKGLFDVNTVLQARRSLLKTSDEFIDASESSWTTAAELAGHLQREQFP